MNVQYMYDSIDSGSFVLSVFLDFKKTFDTVNHKILLSKNDFYSIRGVSHEWPASYLSERNQITMIKWWNDSLLFFNKSWSSIRVCLSLSHYYLYYLLMISETLLSYSS